MRKIIIIFIAIILLMVTACQQTKKNEVYTDIETIQHYFENFSGIERVYWITGDRGEDLRLLPSIDYWVKGFAFISEEATSELEKDYVWDSSSFEETEEVKNIRNEILELKLDNQWSTNVDFTEDTLPKSFSGQILIDFENRLMFYELYST